MFVSSFKAVNALLKHLVRTKISTGNKKKSNMVAKHSQIEFTLVCHQKFRKDGSAVTCVSVGQLLT